MTALVRLVPHALTLANLAAGAVSCIALVRGDYHWVVPCFVVSATADFLDGFAARAAGVSGPFGRELDSLADMVSFGLAPGLMIYAMLAAGESGGANPWAYGGLLVPVLSAVRLARFNVAQADVKHFIGLATPACTVACLGLFQVWLVDGFGFRELLGRPAVLLPVAGLLSLLLVSDVPYFSNKLDPRAARNWPVWVVAIAALTLPWVLGWLAVPVAMTLYLLSPLVWRPA